MSTVFNFCGDILLNELHFDLSVYLEPNIQYHFGHVLECYTVSGLWFS